MAAIVCGLQSHLETQLVESRTTLKLRCTNSVDLSFKPYIWDPNTKPQHEENSNKFISSNSNMGAWISIEALSNVSQTTKEEPSREETAYVHPQVKRSSLVLSSQSLQLCTENLGNESGTDIAETTIDMLSSPKNYCGASLETEKQREPRQHFAAKKAKTLNFPPPLTTIRGSESLRVRPHRVDGRLVIEVTKDPPCFQAQRSHGRLRLSLLKNQTPSFDPEEADDARENETLGSEELEEDWESEMRGKREVWVEEKEEQESDMLQETGEEEAEEEETGEQEFVACGCDDESDFFNMEMYERPRRCKEGGEHENNELLLNWSEPLWVATTS